TDTICSFVVPDTQSNMSNKFWLVTKGFGRYDSTYSPVFYIKRTPGIKESEISQFSIRHPKLTISPNPFRKSTVISYSPSGINDQLPSPTLQIYDATGRLVKRFDHSFPSGGIQPFERITWEGTDDSGCNLPPGVYFIRFTVDGYKKVAKVIKID
ncbi:MAG: T9SS type A sorting domain-containing protein, partial [bacterium]